jgi:hypothetical protein
MHLELIGQYSTTFATIGSYFVARFIINIEKMPKLKRPRLESKEADVTIRLKVEERKEGASFIAYNAMGNILCDFSVKEFMRAKT